MPGEFKLLNSKSNPVQLVLDSKAKNERSNPMGRVVTHFSGYIFNVLIPFLDKLDWLSKKNLDYKDWKLILSLKQKGWHFSELGREIITTLINRMNNNRLSTNNYSATDITDLENKIKYLLENSNFEIHDNGKIYIKSSQTYLKGRGNIQIDVFNEKGNLFQSFESIKMAAVFFKTNERAINRILAPPGGAKFFFNGEYYNLKRVTSLI